MGLAYKRRTGNLYDPASDKPYRLSHSRLEIFRECPRCFYRDRRLGIGRPPGFPFTLHIAVDNLLKKEFDRHRAQGTVHPLYRRAGLDLIPFPDMNLMHQWRDNQREGIQYPVPGTNLVLMGLIDDLLINRDNTELTVADCKATATSKVITGLNEVWHDQYRRQLDRYVYILRHMGLQYRISGTAYVLYFNGKLDREQLDYQLHFEPTLIPYQVDDSWVEADVRAAYDCLQSTILPPAGPECPYCQYVDDCLSV